MAGSTIKISTDGASVHVVMIDCGKLSARSLAMALEPADAEAIGQRLIEVARVARMVGIVR